MAMRIGSVRATQRRLLLIWGLTFAADLCAIVYLYAVEWIELDHLTAGIQKVSTIYAPYLGMMAVFYWGAGRPPTDAATGASDGRTRHTAGVLALCCSTLYNGLMALFVVRLVFGVGTIEDTLEITERLASTLGWLVAPALGYYFMTSTTTAPK